MTSPFFILPSSLTSFPFNERPPSTPTIDPKLSSAASTHGFVPPRVISSREHHTHSIIVLHGRGSTGDLFAAQFLAAQLSPKKKSKDMAPVGSSTVRTSSADRRLADGMAKLAVGSSSGNANTGTTANAGTEPRSRSGSIKDYMPGPIPPFRLKPLGSPAVSRAKSASSGSSHSRSRSEVQGHRHSLLGGCFPGAKYIFPTARFLPAARSSFVNQTKSVMSQWFDVWDLQNQDATHLDVQYEGLRETTAYLRGIVEVEAARVGLGNVVVVGLSQGAAVALHLLMSLEPAQDLNLSGGADDSPTRKPGSVSSSSNKNSPTLGGFAFLSGWFPLASSTAAASLPDEITSSSASDDFDDDNEAPDATSTTDHYRFFHFSSPDSATTNVAVSSSRDTDAARRAARDPDLRTRQFGALNFAREICELPALASSSSTFCDRDGKEESPPPPPPPAFARTPIFIGHGLRDETVPFQEAVRSRDLLARLGVEDVELRSYEDVNDEDDGGDDNVGGGGEDGGEGQADGSNISAKTGGRRKTTNSGVSGSTSGSHWWKEPEEVDDLVAFLGNKCGLEIRET